MIELARSSVQTWECDQMGHMNVQFYVEKAGDALASLAATFGLGPKRLAATRQILEPMDQHIRFLRELRPGTPYFLRGGVVAADTLALTSYCELVQTANDEVAATIRTVSQLRNAQTGSIHGFDDGMRAMALHHKVEVPAHGAPRGLTLSAARPTPTLAEADALKLIPTFQGIARAQECDVNGTLQPRFFMARVSDAIPNLIVQTSGRNRGEPGSTGGAALEYRFVYRAFPRADTLIAIRSGLKSVAEKTYAWVHWLFDVETGEAFATAEAVAVAMDMQTRKAIAIPPDMRARLETLIVPGLGV
jgi:acyl-CoA thioester hydrolase